MITNNNMDGPEINYNKAEHPFFLNHCGSEGKNFHYQIQKSALISSYYQYWEGSDPFLIVSMEIRFGRRCLIVVVLW